MKNLYEKPELEVLEIDVEDIITLSVGELDEDETPVVPAP
jgi:hypothetical protein